MEPVLLTEGFPTVCLYPATSPERPLLVLNSIAEEGDRVAEACSDLDLSLLILRDLHWDDDLSPWPAPALSKKDPPFSGGADAHLARIREEFLPEARRRIPGDPSFTAIVGYSMAGLFALYALTRCDLFSRCASMSGSLWYPGVEDYLKRTAPMLPPERIYLSLGDKEAKTRHPVLRSVQDVTEHLRDHYRTLGIDTRWELNPGNHFTDPVSRTVRGIRAILN